MDTIKIEKKNTLMVAHRGVSGLEKENSKQFRIELLDTGV